MPLIAIIEYCQFEDVPKDLSKTYFSIKQFYGEAFADLFTYEVEVKLSDPVRDHIHSGGTSNMD